MKERQEQKKSSMSPQTEKCATWKLSNKDKLMWLIKLKWQHIICAVKTYIFFGFFRSVLYEKDIHT